MRLGPFYGGSSNMQPQTEQHKTVASAPLIIAVALLATGCGLQQAQRAKQAMIDDNWIDGCIKREEATCDRAFGPEPQKGPNWRVKGQSAAWWAWELGHTDCVTEGHFACHEASQGKGPWELRHKHEDRGHN